MSKHKTERFQSACNTKSSKSLFQNRTSGFLYGAFWKMHNFFFFFFEKGTYEKLSFVCLIISTSVAERVAASCWSILTHFRAVHNNDFCLAEQFINEAPEHNSDEWEIKRESDLRPNFVAMSSYYSPFSSTTGSLNTLLYLLINHQIIYALTGA